MRTVEEVRNRLFDIINAPNVDEKGFDAILRQFGQEVREENVAEIKNLLAYTRSLDGASSLQQAIDILEKIKIL